MKIKKLILVRETLRVLGTLESSEILGGWRPTIFQKATQVCGFTVSCDDAPATGQCTRPPGCAV